MAIFADHLQALKGKVEETRELAKKFIFTRECSINKMGLVSPISTYVLLYGVL